MNSRMSSPIDPALDPQIVERLAASSPEHNGHNIIAQGRRRAQQATERVRQQIVGHPVAAIGAALVVGAVAGAVVGSVIARKR
jgi:ElaB/YqjD/DUF883 family membrane-anchored ribosome-binding protein